MEVESWLLLQLIVVVECCFWLLLLIAPAGCCCWLLLLIAVVDCCCWLLLLIAQKVFEYFRNIVDDLRPRQFCRRKSLWIFSGCWWKVFEYFRVVGEKSLNFSRILMRGKRKRVSPRGNRLESGMNAMAVCRLFILEFPRWTPFKWEPIRSFGKKWRAGRLGL